MTRRIVTLLLLSMSFAACGQPSAPASATPPEDARLAGSYRADRNGWIYVHVQGSPDRLGFQHGYLLAPEIADLLRVTKPLLQQLTKHDWAFYRDAAEEMLWPKIELEYQQEL